MNERKVLFEIPTILVYTPQGVIPVYSMAKAAQKMIEVGGNIMQRCGTKVFLEHGVEQLPFPEKEQKYIVFGEEMAHETQRFSLSQAYSKLIPSLPTNSVVLDPSLLRLIARGTMEYNGFGLGLENIYNMDVIFYDKEFLLGNGQVTFFGDMRYDVNDVLAEFKNGLDCYSFIKINSVFYRKNGTSQKTNDAQYFFLEECRISAEVALKKSAIKSQIEKWIAGGHRDFVYDKKYDHIFPAPANTTFISTETLFSWK